MGIYKQQRRTTVKIVYFNYLCSGLVALLRLSFTNIHKGFCVLLFLSSPTHTDTHRISIYKFTLSLSPANILFLVLAAELRKTILWGDYYYYYFGKLGLPNISFFFFARRDNNFWNVNYPKDIIILQGFIYKVENIMGECHPQKCLSGVWKFNFNRSVIW